MAEMILLMIADTLKDNDVPCEKLHAILEKCLVTILLFKKQAKKEVDYMEIIEDEIQSFMELLELSISFKEEKNQI